MKIENGSIARLARGIKNLFPRERLYTEYNLEDLHRIVIGTLRLKIEGFDEYSGVKRFVFDDKRTKDWLTVQIKQPPGGKEITLEREGMLEPGASFTDRIVITPNKPTEYFTKIDLGYIKIEHGGWQEVKDNGQRLRMFGLFIGALQKSAPQDEPKWRLPVVASGIRAIMGEEG